MAHCWNTFGLQGRFAELQIWASTWEAEFCFCSFCIAWAQAQKSCKTISSFWKYYRNITVLRPLPREGHHASVSKFPSFCRLTSIIVAIQMGCYNTSQIHHLNTSASCSLTCCSLQECCSSLVLRYQSYLVMKEAVLLWTSFFLIT